MYVPTAQVCTQDAPQVPVSVRALRYAFLSQYIHRLPTLNKTDDAWRNAATHYATVHQQTLPDVLLNNFVPAVASAFLLPKVRFVFCHDTSSCKWRRVVKNAIKNDRAS